MNKAFEEYFKQYFNNQREIPNPFNQEKFLEYISNQINNAMPNNKGEHNFENLFKSASAKSQDANVSETEWTVENQNENVKSNVAYKVFETHDFVIARVAMRNLTSDSKKSIFLNSHELFIKEEGREHPLLHVMLPKLVNSKKAKATVQGGILEIHMVKKAKEPLNEFEITELVKESEFAE